jgi:tellurite resistance protein TerC
METIGTPALWVGFLVFVFAMLALDLGVFNRKAHAIGFKTALRWTGVWISVALIFGAIVYWRFGAERSLQFYTGWLIEYALSVDNIFVMLVIFTTFAVPQEYRHKVLYWGILGALVMRAASPAPR